jgi:iron(III) transport system substrate-binding protein
MKFQPHFRLLSCRSRMIAEADRGNASAFVADTSLLEEDMKLKKGTALLALALASLTAHGGAPAGYPADYDQVIAKAKREGKLVVYSVLSNKAAQPLVNDFRKLYPEIDVAYDGEKGSNEVDERYRSEVAAGTESADVMWSSAMDLQMKLVEDGYAQTYVSPETPRLPAWASYGGKAYGTTFEPVVFIYNRNLVKEEDIPRDHASLARTLANKTELFKGKVTSFDIEKSGVGYLFAVQDRKHFAGLDGLLQQFGRIDYQPSGGTGTMLEKVSSGQYLFGYNIMGAYAMVRSKKDLPGLGVVFPKDYTLILSRVMFISKQARHPNAAKLWTDYLLSERGQKVIGDALELYAVRDDIDAKYTARELNRMLGASARPIPLGAEIVQGLDPSRQAAFIQRWKDMVSDGKRSNPS